MREVRDEFGQLIKPLDVIKVFHFVGARRKKHFMYKWVVIHPDTNELFARHLTHEDPWSGYWLWPQMNADGLLMGTEVVQTVYEGD